MLRNFAKKLNTMNKKALLTTFIHEQEHIISDLETLIKTNLSGADLDEDDTRDLDDFARQDTLSEMNKRLENQLNDAKVYLEILDGLDISAKETVAPGAVVETDKFNFFISVPNNGIEFNEKRYVGMSTDAPIYQFLKGKKEGETVKFGKQEYTIKAVY